MVGTDIWKTDYICDKNLLSYTIKDLQPGEKYVFRLKAYNVHGYSEPSLESDIVQLDEHGKFFGPISSNESFLEATTIDLDICTIKALGVYNLKIPNSSKYLRYQ